MNPSQQIAHGTKRFDQVVGALRAAGSGFRNEFDLFDDQIDLSLALEWHSPPGRGMIAPFDEFRGGELQLLHRRGAVERIARSQTNERPPKAKRAFSQLLLHPGAEGALVEARGLLFRQLLKGWIDERFRGL